MVPWAALVHVDTRFALTLVTAREELRGLGRARSRHLGRTQRPPGRPPRPAGNHVRSGQVRPARRPEDHGLRPGRPLVRARWQELVESGAAGRRRRRHHRRDGRPSAGWRSAPSYCSWRPATGRLPPGSRRACGTHCLAPGVRRSRPALGLAVECRDGRCLRADAPVSLAFLALNFFCRGSKASRRPSPMKLMLRQISTMNRPGNQNSHGPGGEGLLVLRDEQAQRGVRGLDADAEVAQGRLGEDRGGHGQRDVDDQHADGVGQDVLEDDPGVAGARRSGRRPRTRVRAGRGIRRASGGPGPPS